MPRRMGFRSSDGAALVRKNLCGFEEVKYDENVRFFWTDGPAEADVECGFPHDFLRKSCSFFALENSLRTFAVWFMEE